MAFLRRIRVVDKLARFLAYFIPAAYVNSYCFSMYTVVGGSMQPSLNPIESGVRKDRVLIDKITPWLFSRVTKDNTSVPSFKVGDVILFTSPHDPERTLIKRIVALEGNSIRVSKHGHSGALHGKDDRMPPSASNYIGINCLEALVSVPSGYVWVESDEPHRGYDSTHFGPIPMGLIQGRVVIIIWPLDRIGSIALKPRVDIVGQKVYSPLSCKKDDS